MTDLKRLFQSFEHMGIEFFTGVPDSLLNDFCMYLSDKYDARHHVMAANEGNAVAIASGYHLATRSIPVVYMQNSGIGNAMNPLLSLTHSCVYSIPMILVIGWRGDPSTKDHAQHKKQGVLTTVLMDDMDIPYHILDDEDMVIEDFSWAHQKALEIQSPVALIVKKGILSKKEKKQEYPISNLMSREEAISQVIDMYGSDAIYLATTGRVTRELHEQLTLHDIEHNVEFLNVGAMGHLSSIGLGIALGSPKKKIIVFDGDAASIMHMGSLTTIGRYKPQNLIHIILNNGVNESVGGQESPGWMIDISTVASACCYNILGGYVNDKNSLRNVLAKVSTDGPCLIDVHVKQGIRPDLPKLSVCHKDLKKKLMTELTNI